MSQEEKKADIIWSKKVVSFIFYVWHTIKSLWNSPRENFKYAISTRRCRADGVGHESICTCVHISHMKLFGILVCTHICMYVCAKIFLSSVYVLSQKHFFCIFRYFLVFFATSCFSPLNIYIRLHSMTKRYKKKINEKKNKRQK